MLLSFLLDLLFPHTCAGCGVWFTLLCPRCYNDLEFRNLPLHQDLENPALDYISVCLGYSNSVRTLLHRLKYGGIRDAGNFLGELLYYSGKIPEFDLIVPVPIHPSRLRVRGYNQAELIANALASKLRSPVVESLKRTVASKSQASTSSKIERLHNLKGHFQVDENLKDRVLGKKILLIDDVVTTGMTLQQCASLLKESGAKSVSAMVIATSKS